MLSCFSSGAPLRNPHSLEKLRDVAVKAMEDLSGLSFVMAEDPTQALQQQVGSSGVSPASTKRRRLSLVGFIVGCSAVIVTDVAPDGVPADTWASVLPGVRATREDDDLLPSAFWRPMGNF